MRARLDMWMGKGARLGFNKLRCARLDMYEFEDHTETHSCDFTTPLNSLSRHIFKDFDRRDIA